MSPNRVLDEITRSAVDVLSPVDHAGITLVRRHHAGGRATLQTSATSDHVARRFDELQHEVDDGPCFEAIWQHRTVQIDDMETEDRWPRLTAATLKQTPIRSTLSMQLYIEKLDLGALNLHSHAPHAFDEDTQDLALVLATHAAIALSTARRGEHFRSALASRDIIGQAKGMIMERFGVDAVAAFTMLRQLSQESNIALAEVAAQMVNIEHPRVTQRDTSTT
ncbi:GAF and ANTAR domain-containing protein [Gordonia asplenii]|uniref:GAF and ANTAR domain-containing protein n=1 Tax=Gordonia asplenii TaxID=2725283 RepID=UPI0028A648BC|nr:GAF and ANTAR domain-containing protein [Gordonia asplenii]